MENKFCAFTICLFVGLIGQASPVRANLNNAADNLTAHYADLISSIEKAEKKFGEVRNNYDKLVKPDISFNADQEKLIQTASKLENYLDQNFLSIVNQARSNQELLTEEAPKIRAGRADGIKLFSDYEHMRTHLSKLQTLTQRLNDYTRIIKDRALAKKQVEAWKIESDAEQLKAHAKAIEKDYSLIHENYGDSKANGAPAR